MVTKGLEGMKRGKKRCQAKKIVKRNEENRRVRLRGMIKGADMGDAK